MATRQGVSRQSAKCRAPTQPEAVEGGEPHLLTPQGGIAELPVQASRFELCALNLHVIHFFA